MAVEPNRFNRMMVCPGRLQWRDSNKASIKALLMKANMSSREIKYVLSSSEEIPGVGEFYLLAECH